MKKIIYKKLSKQFSPKKLKNYFDEVIPGKTLKQCQNIIKNSVIVGAFDANKLIGIGRSLDDNVYAFITDIVVHHDYKKQNIGNKIVKMLCSQLLKKNIIIIHCSTTKELIPFYKSVGEFTHSHKDITLYLKKF